ncbi:MAG: SPFH domain-containing protein [Bacteroidota bacterium]
MDSILFIVIGQMALLFMMMFFAARRYIKCPSNKLLVVYGRVAETSNGSGVQIIRNGATFVWPVIQHYFFLDLEEHKIELSPKVKTKDGIDIQAKVTFIAGISPDDPHAAAAAQRLALKSKKMIVDLLTDIAYSATSKVFQQMDLVELATTSDSQIINRLVQATAKEFRKLGVLITTCKVDFIEDTQAILQNIEEQFQQQQVLSDSPLPSSDGAKELEKINNQLQQNTKEREELLHQKITLLARLGNATKS